jgi:NADPH-dependent 2,4-dienoyl-CoA reductase/sulfur reductase-like enzyme
MALRTIIELAPPSNLQSMTMHHVVVVGAGFGGLESRVLWPARRSVSRS